MLDRIQIRNFQSLTDVSLDLAPLTVIVGPSSSGKSAFIRSLRALAGNRRGTDFITHGERVASVSAHLTSRDPLRSGTVTLTRSTATAPNSYTIIPDDDAHPLAPKAEYTKLGGEVPEDVSQFLGIPTDQISLAIASQFDKPFLLDAPGTEVARTLGSLTNAHIILNGARESNRQKLANSQTLRTRSEDLEAIKARVPEFRALKAQREALDAAEALIADAQVVQEQAQRLAVLIETQEIAEARIPALRDVLAGIPDPGELDVSLTSLYNAQKEVDRYSDALKTVSGAQQAVKRFTEQVVTATEEHDAALSAVQSVMRDVAQGFHAYFSEHGDADEHGRMSVRVAAGLAAKYLAQLDA